MSIRMIMIYRMSGNEGMDKPRVAILGARGMLGSDVAEIFRQQEFNISAYDLPEFDITNVEHLSNALEHIDVVINCAAYTNVEKAEQETERAFKINADAVKYLGQIAKDYGIWVLHISTDFVFDGKSEKPYTEKDNPNPINAYGKSKLKGEQLLLETKCPLCILRVEWTYGLNGDNFVKKIIKRAETDEKIKVVDDQIGSPTATSEAAKVILKLVSKQPVGIFHFAAAGYTTRHDCARFILKKMNLPISIEPCRTDDFETLADRPLNSCFNCSKIQRLLNLNIKPWQEPLELFLKQL